MDDNISRYFYEMSEAKNERTLKRIVIFGTFLTACLVAIIIVLSVMLYKEHGKFVDFLAEFELVEETVTVENENGEANYIGGDGSIIHGEDNSKEKDRKKEGRQSKENPEAEE